MTQITKLVVLCCRVAHSVKHNFLAGFRYLLKPLVRIAIRAGITFPQFGMVLRGAYVDSARVELGSKDGADSIDAISVMTEISREDINVLLRASDDEMVREAEITLNAASRVLVGWHTDRDYIGPYGLVRDLEFSNSDSNLKNGAKNFTDLAEFYCDKYPPEALMQELIRTSCVEDLGNGFYRAISRSYVPEPLSPESIRHLAKVLHTMAETLEINLRADANSKRLERTIFADFGLCRDDLGEFEKYIRERAQIFADDIDNWLSMRSVEGQRNSVQTGVGLYHYILNEDDERDYKLDN